MKKLQNNFTNTEQSKRLLELGVPEWTADLRYRICKSNDSILGNPYLTKGKKYIGSHFNSSLPCWSVGRLIEIWELCTSTKFERWTHNGVYMPLLDDCIAHIRFALNPDTTMETDFSELEEWA